MTIKNKILLFVFAASLQSVNAQIIPNGTIDNLDELSKKETVYTVTKDGIKLYTDIYYPVFRDSITADVPFGGTTYTIQVIPKNAQFVIYDTTNIGPENYSLPIIYTRTPYSKAGDDLGGSIFPFMGYGYAIQDMRGRYESEGVYFPMYSDSWQKNDYHPGITIPVDLANSSDPSNAIYHSDGSESILYLADSLMRVFDTNLDGIMDTIKYSNGSIGMYGASALGNSQYQALSDIPHGVGNNPIKCLMPTVATNEHYNTTLFHNGVYRNSLTSGWLVGQMTSGVYDTLVGTDMSTTNSLHSPADYGYTSSMEVAIDLIDWFVADEHATSPSGAHPTTLLRKDLDASQAPVNALGETDANGTYSRYDNLNKPIYHLTGWWDIFVNGQIETFNNVRKANPTSNQKLVIGPWTHQTIGTNTVGDEIYPDNVYDIIGFDLGFDVNDILTDGAIVNEIYGSELLNWYRTNLGGEPFFIIPESHDWQMLGSNEIRVPAKDYIIPYYEFLNYIGGVSDLNNLPIEIKIGGTVSPTNYSLPTLDPPLIQLAGPLGEYDPNYFSQAKDIRMYITGPSNDAANASVGNYWFGTDSLPFVQGMQMEKLFLHQNNTLDNIAPTGNEGDITYTTDPNDPVITIGGNNMIPNVPGGGQKSQGSMNVANPAYASYTMTRSDVIAFESTTMSDTVTYIGFPKATIYAKGNATAQGLAKTDFDLMVRILDVYPDGREMLITEGTVNARARDYAKSIHDADTNDLTILTNIDNNTFHPFEFDLLPLGHTFGVNHKMKVLISSSNYPKYQSNPNIPNNAGEFFRWIPGDTIGYDYNGTWIYPQSSDITLEFSDANPSFIEMPNVYQLPNDVAENQIEKSLHLYPNPTNDILFLERNFNEECIIEVYNLLGAKVIEKKLGKNAKNGFIDVSALDKGVYLLMTVAKDGASVAKKFVVQ